jgi:hypothetical protein
MQSVYRMLLEVEIRHDYFLLPSAGTHYTEDYDISSLIHISPSLETAKLMRDHKMVFKATRTGFAIYVQAEFISAAVGYATLIDVDPGMSLSFYWTLRDKRFINYTNQRLIENGKKIYYFSNRTGSQQGGITYLNKAIPSFGTPYPGETNYHLGDIISQGGQTLELIEMLAPTVGFTATQWQTINTAITNYVNPSDRLAWQSSYYHHQRPNISPGEFINYTILNADGLPVDLGFITGTNLPQSEYRAPVNAADAVNNTLNLGHLKPGRYSIQIAELGGTTTASFFLMNTTIQPDLFAVSEFFISGAALPFQFVTENVALKRWILDDPAKRFLVRFRNRLTRWRYLNQDQSLFHQAPAPRPLTKTFSNYSIVVGGNTVNLPDPPVEPVLPEIDTPTRLLKNIHSQIFLTT